MKKILFFLFFTGLLIFSSRIAFAHDLISQEVSTQAGSMESATISAENKSVYSLPYPGLLPDNPLYFVKALRDKIIEILTSDPIKKADFYLLQADKRVNEGQMLFDKGKTKYSMGITAMSKGENYFEKGILQLQFAKKQNLPIDSLIQKYHVSSQKHEEVVGALLKGKEGDVKSGLTQIQERIAKYHKWLEDLEK